MTDPTTEVILPRRGVAARALTFLAGVLLGFAFYILMVRPLPATHFLWMPEQRSQDLLVKLRPKPPVHPDIVEVALSNTIRQLVDVDGDPIGGRSIYATLIRRIAGDGARVIVLDTYLPDRTTRDQDGALWRAMADTGIVFLPIKYNANDDNVLTGEELRNLYDMEFSVLHDQRSTVVPDAEMERYSWWKFQAPVWDFTRNAGGGKTAGVGMALYQADPDRVVRHIQYAYLTDLVYPPNLPPSPLQRQWQGANVFVPSEVIPPALRMFKVSKDMVTVTLGRELLIAGDLNPRVALPMDEWGRAPISFVGPPGTIPVINAANVLDGKAPKDTFRNKLVVLGVMGPFTKSDNVVTPVSGAHPRMDITAQALNSVLTRKPLVRSTHMAFVPLVLLAIVAGLLIPMPWRAGRSTVVAVLVLVAYLIVAFIAAWTGVLLPVLSAVLLVLLIWLLSMVFKAAFPV